MWSDVKIVGFTKKNFIKLAHQLNFKVKNRRIFTGLINGESSNSLLDPFGLYFTHSEILFESADR